MTSPQTTSSRPTVVAVANAKGGVGKTSIVANAAGIATLAGWRVLAIDLDPQGNLSTDLGYGDRTDHGRSLGATLRSGEAPRTLADVRAGLDVWAGGSGLATGVHAALIPEIDHPLSAAIAATGTRYDFVFIDCPPAIGPLSDAGLIAADWLIVPVRADHASLHGLELMADRFRQVKTSANPALRLLGVVLFDVSPQSTAILREVEAAIIEHILGAAPLLQPPIRRSERSAFDMRRMGLLAHEYEERYLDAESVPLTTRIEAARRGEPVERFSSAASGLANDYFEITKQILTIVRAGDRPPAAAAARPV